jgi:excisionase family DNA binding protein
MDTLQIPGEKDFKQWVKEALKEYMDDLNSLKTKSPDGEPLLSRDTIAEYLDISLVTLTDWMKRGLPFHKQRGRVYFIRSEVMEYIKMKQLGK